jgi:hypothetical protein
MIVAALVLLRTLDIPSLLLRRHTTVRPINDSVLWTSVCAIVLAYLLIGSFWFQPWYLVWLLAPAALLPHSQLTRTILPWYSLGVLCSSLLSDFFFYETRSTWTRTNQTSLIVATMLIPLLLAVLFSIWQQRQKRSDYRTGL